MQELNLFLLSKARCVIGKIANQYIDDVIRIYVDNVTFTKEHDDIINSTSYKLTKEDKTTGLIEFRRAGCYKHYDNDKFTTKNWKNDNSEEKNMMCMMNIMNVCLFKNYLRKL